MTKDQVKRELVCEGSWCSISYAIRKDGSPAPAREVIECLESGTWQDGEDIGMHVDEQVRAYARLMHTMQYYAETGEGDQAKSMNALDRGIFEFKAGRARVAFFDTPGDGTWSEKQKIDDRDDALYPDNATWFIPDLDEHLRLCNGWPKKARVAKPCDINFACQVRIEDLKYDQGDKDD